MPYEFTQDGYREFSQAIIDAKGDQATITSILADMQDTVTDNIGKLMKLTQDTEAVTAENERLRNANMELFLRIGSQGTEPGGGDKTKPGGDEEKPVSTAEYMEQYFNKMEEKK